MIFAFVKARYSTSEQLFFGKFFKTLTDAKRLIVGYDKRQNCLTEEEQKLEAGCGRIKRLILAVQPQKDHNGSKSWEGKHIDRILATV